jgi:hypothetical protein
LLIEKAISRVPKYLYRLVVYLLLALYITEETVKVEKVCVIYLTREQDKKNNNDLNNPNPFVSGAAVWQSLMTYWLNAYGEFLKNAPKMTEYWYDTYWKPWLSWAPQQQQKQGQDRDKVNIE